MFEYEILENKIKVSVVILTHSPKDCLVDNVKMLLKQSVKPFEIIVVNTDENKFYDNLIDDNKHYLENLIRDSIIIAKHIDINEFDHGKTRNMASKMANGDYIICLLHLMIKK